MESDLPLPAFLHCSIATSLDFLLLLEAMLEAILMTCDEFRVKIVKIYRRGFEPHTATGVKMHVNAENRTENFDRCKI